MQDKREVALELVELTFKSQYVGRNDMSRISTHLKNTCVYVGKEVVVGGMRARVTELWMRNRQKVSTAEAEASQSISSLQEVGPGLNFATQFH